MASFIGPAVLDEDGARACEPLGELTAGAGRFNCDVDTPVRASTAGMTLQSRKRDIAFCRSLEHFSQTQGSHVDAAPERWPDVYQYGWTDDCTDGACQIVVDLSFSGAAILEATGGKSDAVDVRVSGTLSGDELAGNPFSGVQGLAMSLVSLQFRKPGETAIAAVCDWYPQSVDIGGPYQHVVFTSQELPPP